MRRRQSTTSWYFCICRYWEVYQGFWTQLGELWSYSGFLLVLCPDCIFVHLHRPFPERRVLSCCLGTTTCPVPLCLASFKWQELLHLFSPFFPPSGSLLLTICKGHTDTERFEAEDQLLRTAWSGVVLPTEFCPIMVIWICYVKANCSIVGRSQRFSFLDPTCQH